MKKIIIINKLYLKKKNNQNLDFQNFENDFDFENDFNNGNFISNKPQNNKNMNDCVDDNNRKNENLQNYPMKKNKNRQFPCTVLPGISPIGLGGSQINMRKLLSLHLASRPFYQYILI